jgi:O-antigen ligase
VSTTTISLQRRRPRTVSLGDVRLRRVRWIWALLFFNVLTYEPGGILPLPHKVGEAITQSALVVALVLALSINPRLEIRPNSFLTLYSMLAISSLATSVDLVSVGTTYRAVRLITFVAVLWLLTPWFGRRDLLLVRTYMVILSAVFVSVLLGLMISPHKALAVQHRLGGALWPIFTTNLAAFMADFVAIAVILWLCRLLRPRLALLAIVPGLGALLATHTRTALIGMAVGLMVASLSLFTSQRRARQTLLTVALVGVVALVPLFGFVTTWLGRGQSTTQIQDLSGRTLKWTAVLSEPKPLTNKILGSGLSNGSVEGALNTSSDGLPIDSGYIATYQDQGIVGLVLEGAMFLVLLVTALLRPRGPAKAIALYLIVYCLLSSFTQSGIGEASSCLLDLALAVSLLMPAWESGYRPAGWGWARRVRYVSGNAPGWNAQTRSLFRG